MLGFVCKSFVMFGSELKNLQFIDSQCFPQRGQMRKRKSVTRSCGAIPYSAFCSILLCVLVLVVTFEIKTRGLELDMK